MADEKKAAFGVFPQMRPRRSVQDPEAAKYFPVDLARGFTAGVLGVPGETELLGRLAANLQIPQNMRMPRNKEEALQLIGELFGADRVSLETKLPTTEEIEPRIPFGSDTPVSRAAAEAGGLAGSFYTGPLSAYRAAKAIPQAVKRAGKDFVQAAGQTVSPLTVYHGSPHKFEKFDPSKIGTGEGAQAYGHGLYFAESPNVATSYKNLVQRDPNRLTVDGKVVPPDTMYGRAAEDVVRIGLKATLQKIDDNIRFNEKYAPDMANMYKDLRTKIEALEPTQVNLKEGSLYTVDLPDEKIARMLDWDKPLSQQNETVQALAQRLGVPIDKATGENLHKAALFHAGAEGKDPVAAAAMLREAGIPGIKYLDQSSRAAGEGTRNFVVFPGEEEALTILERKKKGGSVHISNNPDTMRLELAIGGALGKGAKAAKAAKAAEKAPAVPLDIPRVRPTKEVIQAAAERVGRQQLGEHVTSPLTGTKNLAGRSMKESERVKNLQYDIQPIKEVPKAEPYQPKVGEVNIALPGDQTVSDMILKSVEDTPIGSTQQGGALFGQGRLTDPEEIRAFWASNVGASQAFQNKVTALAQMFDTDLVTAYHLAMGMRANNFAQHFADANIRAIDYSKLSKNAMDIFDSHIAAGFKNPQTGEMMTFPDWPGIANPEQALEAMKNNSELRKWFNNRMKTPALTQPLNLPDGRSIEYAITEPDIRNMEINLTGLSAGRMKPGAELMPETRHQTYSHGIPGTAIGKAPELAPFEISFPDVTSFVREKYRPQDFTGTIQKVFPHQIVDEAYLEDMQRYYDHLRRVRGYREGGPVDPNEGGVIDMNDGGDITADDLMIEERPL